MSKAKRNAAFAAADPKSAPVNRASAADRSARDPVAVVLSALVLGLLGVRWLVPTESAVDGDTLWIAQLWFAAALLWTWSGLRSGKFTVRAGLFDAALWTLIGGHWVSTAAVFLSGGDRRAALNMAWEWTSVGVSFFCLRQVVSTWLDARRLASILVALGVVLGGYGIWQHYFFYDVAYQEYHALVTELDTLRKNPAGHEERINTRMLNLHELGAPSDPAGRAQYENRIHFSSEAFGPFGLANTFAGLLLVTLVTTAELYRTAPRPLPRWIAAAWVAAAAIQGYCLILTKSRTAWVALVVAMACWGVCSLGRIRKSFGRRTITAGLVAATGILLLIAAAAVSGGLDNKVISESRKSLSYRVQYWQGAARILRDHWLFGPGPGNFRHAYLAHKLAKSSEEIADPHNWLLDLWNSGGLLALAGFAACVITATITIVRAQRRSLAAGEDMPAAGNASPALVLAGATIGFVLASFAPLLGATGRFEAFAIVLLLGWLAAFAVLRPDLGARPMSVAALGSAALGLLVHLSGAGGIEMPAIVQLFLVLGAMAFASIPSGQIEVSARPALRGIGVAAITLFICCLWTATLPVLNRRALVARGEDSLMLHANFARAIADFTEAAARDPLSPSPPAKISEAYFSRWQLSPSPSDEDFRRGVKFLELAMTMDRHDPFPHRRLGQMYHMKFARTRNPQDAQNAVDALSQAVSRYPNEASLRGERAEALRDAGHADEARREAELALDLNWINYEEEHSDRYLPDDLSYRLHRLAQRPPDYENRMHHLVPGQSQ